MKSLDKRIKRELSKQAVYNLGYRTPTDIFIGHEIFQSGFFMKKIVKSAYIEISDVYFTTTYYLPTYNQALHIIEQVGEQIKNKEELVNLINSQKYTSQTVKN